MIKNPLPLLFLLLFATLVGFVAVKINAGAVVETNILALLPQEERSAMERFAEDKMAQHFERKLLLLVGHPSAEGAVHAASEMENSLQKTGLFSALTTHIDSKEIEARISFYQRYQHALLTPIQIKWLKNDDVKAVRSHVLARAYGLNFDIIPQDMEGDPLAFFSDYMAQNLSGNLGGFSLVDNVPIVFFGGLHYVLIQMDLAQNPFSLGYQKRVLQALNATSQASDDNITIIRSGLIFHANNGAAIAKKEMSQMGTLSLLGVFLLMVLVFGSLRPFIVVAGSIIGGALVGFGACLLFFDKVHLLTLVFGTSLIGMSVDYAFHFFSESYNDDEPWDPQKGISNIFSAVTLGLITSIIGFLGLCLTPFLGLQQMAVFCIAGLIFVYGCVVLIYPLLFREMAYNTGRSIGLIATSYIDWWKKRRIVTIQRLGILLLVISVASLPFLHGKDDVRAMQSLSPSLIANDVHVANILGRSISPQFFVVSGADNESMLVNLARFSQKLENQKIIGALGNYHTLSDFISPMAQQIDNTSLLTSFVKRNGDALKSLFSEIALPVGAYDTYLSYLESKESSFFPLAHLLSLSGSEDIAMLYGGEHDRKSLAFITLDAITDLPSIAQLAQGSESVVFIDKVSSVSTLLGHYRQSAIFLAMPAYSVIFIILCWRYGLRQGAALLAPSVLASFVALICIVFLEGSYSLFHVIALFLVMGIGVDYGLFLVEAKRRRKSAMIAIILSALTTLLSFGLLSTSGTSALHDFGITIIIGITVTLLLSPMVLLHPHKGEFENE